MPPLALNQGRNLLDIAMRKISSSPPAILLPIDTIYSRAEGQTPKSPKKHLIEIMSGMFTQMNENIRDGRIYFALVV